MDQTAFLIINGAIVLGLAYWFWRGAKRGRPNQLNLGGSSEPRKTTLKPHVNQKVQSGPRVINVIFNFNGHQWEAFEVLGLPAGSSLAAAEEAFLQQVQRDPESRPFYQEALDAIRRS